MHSHIEKLANMASKPSRMIIGLMSGTSLDGLDIALCRLTGEGLATKVELLNFTTIDYNQDYKQRVKAVFAKRQVDLQMVTLLHPWIGLEHGRLINQCLQQWQLTANDIDIIASHGQTVFHCPKRQHQLAEFPNATLQLGDADHLALTTGIITISDFRQKHLAAGGEGAPLAVYGDYLLFSSPKQNRILLNIGGIANLTYLPSSQDASAVFSSDIGPGNTLMDAYIQAHFPGQYYDQGAALAKAGAINANLLAALKQDRFFSLDFPKTTGPEVFNLAYLQQAQQQSASQGLSHADIMATLNRFTADMIAHAINTLTTDLQPFVVYASGGGIHNPLLMQHLSQALPNVSFASTADLGINPDAKEAVLFAVLANECLVGGKQKFSNSQAGIPSVTMGKISFAD
ncbi:anhydro-N-acetylmuramic acid kinase [Rheinheimera sp. MMS21-TC3]|uniref:anhydro-N-acetylmuramic acid kinase n=1 Tax=Rheinheimera sp. MMS21-TC3 TaxID=3072790 RepID=UPI0028C3BF4E|nr:anhydro-N-acetylmuramic acid kinase [Rheinheimera sp. MMS21-TC3]WNO61714.1 anhydro-N-acetylmuramic acid kinase [Rheinheimera sp. MMS21-TC3]